MFFRKKIALVGGSRVRKKKRPCRALLLCPPNLETHVFPPTVLSEISQSAESAGSSLDPAKWKEDGAALSRADVILGTWGMPVLDAEFWKPLPP